MSRAERRKYHYIYKTTCVVTNRYYIGMHSTDDLEDGYQGSGKRLWYSIRKHGKENHKTEILEFLNSREELRNREAQLVNEELLNDSMCMNLKLGGEGGGICWNEEHKKKFQQAGSKAHSEYLKTNEEYFKSYGEKRTNIFKNKFENGELKYFLKYRFDWSGFRHSDETKKKMSDSHKGKHVGTKNSQHGTCWICHPEIKENKKIQKSELDLFLESGWIKGRNKFIIDLLQSK